MLWLLPNLKVRAVYCQEAVTDMNNKKHPFIFTFNILIFFVLILLHYTNRTSINIFGVTPLLVLPLLTAFSIFHSPLASGVTGLLAGIFMDASTTGSYCFNAIVLLCLGAAVSVTSNNLFNKNIFASVVLSLITGGIYYICQWLIFYTVGKDFADCLMYLLKYAAPSALFSAVFIFPFYFLYKYFHKITSN